jgi:hypothetical protein
MEARSQTAPQAHTGMCNFSIVSGWEDFVKLHLQPSLNPRPEWSWRQGPVVPRARPLRRGAENFRDREHFRGALVSNIMEDVEYLV